MMVIDGRPHIETVFDSTSLEVLLIASSNFPIFLAA